MSDGNKPEVSGYTVLGAIALGCLVIIALSWYKPHFPGPAPWVTAWTAWVGSVIGIAISSRALWVGVKILAKRFL